ncbi:MAG: hypothetical protein KC457_14780, partial [Myxococcales bacterium]|nr:hypothetical protein [Myxococcales bacterium]
MAAPAGADEEPSVGEDGDSIATDLVLIRVLPKRPDVEARLQAELGLLGFVSERMDVEGDEALGPDLLDRIDGSASAAIELEITEARIELWIADAETGKSVYRRLDPNTGDQGDPRTMAIAAVELLRASRLEAAQGEPEPAPDLPDDGEDLPPLQD